MGNEKKTPIDVDGKPYYFEDLTEKQQMIVNHIADLERKIGSSQFNLDQLMVGKEAFIAMLKQELNKEPEAEQGQEEA